SRETSASLGQRRPENANLQNNPMHQKIILIFQCSDHVGMRPLRARRSAFRSAIGAFKTRREATPLGCR
ncbi:MAG: hypothetical protein ACREE7_11980, partial [Dongiaceae bacterium]